MILLLALILAVIVGLVRGGSWERLGNLDIKQGGLALIAVLIQSALIYGPWLDRDSTRSIAIGLMLLSYLPLIVFVALNRRLAGLKVAGLGLLMNLAVIAANGGYMPTSPEALQRLGYEPGSIVVGQRFARSKDMVLERQDTRLWCLSDILVTPAFLPWRFVYSLGDVVLAGGAFILVQKAMLDIDS
ncbi:MAG: DUF5317 domain-containing protein [Chloroflexi bacterium]|nr:DUF5317 domain-containing protein [Chloroflexota bacterium]